MSTALPDLKKQLRLQLRAKVLGLTANQKETYSKSASDLLQRQTAWQESQKILFYSPLSDELDSRPLIFEALKTGKIVLLPKFDAQSQHYCACQIENLEKDYAPGKFGILEPGDHCSSFPLNQLDLILVPGVGFDLSGRRLGRGRGFYDRLLECVSGIKCGVAFDEQVVDTIPVEPHDVRLNCLLTPSQWQICGD